MPEKKPTGRIAADRIRMQSTPKPPAGAQCWSLFSPDSRALPSSSGRASNR